MNDIGHFVLVAVCLYAGMATLLYFLAAVDPQTDRNGRAHPKARAVRRPTDGPPLLTGRDHPTPRVTRGS